MRQVNSFLTAMEGRCCDVWYEKLWNQRVLKVIITGISVIMTLFHCKQVLTQYKGCRLLPASYLCSIAILTSREY